MQSAKKADIFIINQIFYDLKMNTQNESELEKAIITNKNKKKEKCKLMLVHITSYQNLENIINEKQLKPKHCRVLQDEVLYLSYGAPFYKKTAHYTKKPGDYPIVFVFDAKLNDSIDFYFPFDSGAAYDSLSGSGYGSQWVSLAEIQRFYVRKNPEDIVSTFYGTNRSYLEGMLLKRMRKYDEPVPLLRNFLSADLSQLNVDDRHNTIECVTVKNISLCCNLRWVAYPRHLLGQGDVYKLISKLWSYGDDKFKEYDYSVNVNDKHDSLISGIKEAFRKEFAYYERPHGGKKA